MGTRLNVRYPSCDTIIYDGTKMYGYISEEDMHNLSSYKYLKEEIGIFKSEQDEEDFYIFITFGNGSEEDYELTADEFRKFITLYNEDYQNHHASYVTPHNILEEPDIKELMDDDRIKVISWG